MLGRKFDPLLYDVVVSFNHGETRASLKRPIANKFSLCVDTLFPRINLVSHCGVIFTVEPW